MLHEHLITVVGHHLNVAEGPKNGPPLWFFHGLGRRWQDLTPLFAGLSPFWHFHAVDHRGHGKSSHNQTGYLISDYILDAATLIHASESAVIVGHSLGALVALGVAAALPELVRAIVLLDPPGPSFLGSIHDTTYHAMWSGMRRLAGGPVRNTAHALAELKLQGPDGTIRLGDLRDAAALRFMARCLESLDPEVLVPPLTGRWLDRFDLFTEAARVQCPALLLVADPERGGMLTDSDADQLELSLRDCTRVNLPGVGHLVHWQDSAATLRLMHGFLGSLP